MAEIKSFYAGSYLAAKLCTYCGRRLSMFGGRLDSKAKDYLVPLSRGGEDIPENVVASCKECHILKGNYLNYSLLPLFVNRSHLIADVRRYLKEVREVIGRPSSLTDIPR